MAGSFASASSQRLVNTTPPVTNYPFTVAAWVNPVSATVLSNMFALSDAATDNHFFVIGQNATSGMVSSVAAGGAVALATVAGACESGKWTFVVGRFISATNRRISVIAPNGSTVHAVNTTSRAPAGIDNVSIGARESLTPANFYNGMLAEFWYTNTDIQDDGLQLLDSLLRQLAYGGPFSIPHIAKDIVEYRSLRVFPESRGDLPGEVFHGKFGRQVWGNTGGVTIGPHPPLPYWYVKPGQTRRLLTV